MARNDQDEIKRLRTEYARREEDGLSKAKYSRFNPVQLFLLQSRERTLLHLLRKHGITDLSNLSICEIGCGSGGVLQEFLPGFVLWKGPPTGSFPCILWPYFSPDG